MSASASTVPARKKSAATKKRVSARGRTSARSSRGASAGKLRRYRAKRRLEESGEPAGNEASSPPGQPGVWRFVIQKHDATRLHYDLRLEMDGVYKSWAVPKGLPETEGDKTLAVEVEDHPLDYGTFEGTIPKGNYGAGTVMIWDTGFYTVSGGAPGRAWRQGKIHFALVGRKCTGEWTLVRLRDRGESKTSWLLIKNHEARRRAPIKRAGRDKSATSGRSMEQIARGRRQWISNRATSSGAARSAR